MIKLVDIHTVEQYCYIVLNLPHFDAIPPFSNSVLFITTKSASLVWEEKRSKRRNKGVQ